MTEDEIRKSWSPEIQAAVEQVKNKSLATQEATVARRQTTQVRSATRLKQELPALDLTKTPESEYPEIIKAYKESFLPGDTPKETEGDSQKGNVVVTPQEAGSGIKNQSTKDSKMVFSSEEIQKAKAVRDDIIAIFNSAKTTPEEITTKESKPRYTSLDNGKTWQQVFPKTETPAEPQKTPDALEIQPIVETAPQEVSADSKTPEPIATNQENSADSPINTFNEYIVSIESSWQKRDPYFASRDKNFEATGENSGEKKKGSYVEQHPKQALFYKLVSEGLEKLKTQAKKRPKIWQSATAFVSRNTSKVIRLGKDNPWKSSALLAGVLALGAYEGFKKDIDVSLPTIPTSPTLAEENEKTPQASVASLAEKIDQESIQKKETTSPTTAKQTVAPSTPTSIPKPENKKESLITNFQNAARDTVFETAKLDNVTSGPTKFESASLDETTPSTTKFEMAVLPGTPAENQPISEEVRRQINITVDRDIVQNVYYPIRDIDRGRTFRELSAEELSAKFLADSFFGGDNTLSTKIVDPGQFGDGKPMDITAITWKNNSDYGTQFRILRNMHNYIVDLKNQSGIEPTRAESFSQYVNRVVEHSLATNAHNE